MTEIDTLVTNARLATMTATGTPYGALEGAALAIGDGKIVWVGPEAERPAGRAQTTIDADGAWVTPGLIDPHTHLIFAGDRSDEFEERLEGMSYAEIAGRGGGIMATVRATRAADARNLEALARTRLDHLMADGVTTIEIKSGYGLDLETEIRMLEVARRLGETAGIDVRTSFLAAHALPPEFRDDRAGYLDLACEQVLPEVARRGLADAVDAFMEGIAFSAEETARVFEAARRHGLPVKLHADQLSDLGGAALAAHFGALSADHLEYTSGDGVQAMAAAGTVATLLPGAFYMLRETQAPPVDAFRRHRVPIALGSDANPGSSPLLSLLLTMNMGCVLFGLTPEEALHAVTTNAARALGLDDRGTLEVGRRADLVIWQIERPAELASWIGRRPGKVILKDGVALES
jgi:imidazolonepropionase